MYDVSYDSENAKNYNQPNQNVPLQQNYNQPIQNVSLDNSSVGVRQSEFLDQQYCSEKTKYGQTNQNNDNYGNSYLDKEYTSTGRNQMGQPMNYDYVQPNRPQMYPHFPHHPHHPHFPHYPAPKYPYPYAYA